MFRLTNPVKRYAWGSTTALPALLGAEPDGRPVAEIWMGAHPVDPSVNEDGTGLDRLVADDPAATLGPGVRGQRLPFMAKLLAAAAPLSLQVHPTAEQAEAGFRREEAAGVGPDDPGRSYRDRSAKPELLLALEETELLAGFRPPAEADRMLSGLGLDVLAPVVARLRAADAQDVSRAALEAILLDPAPRELADAVTRRVRELERGGRRTEYATVARLAEHHPGDVGIVAALLLNQLRLAPGEVVYVPPGMVHSYLRGAGLEIMATSDNVLRAGLTAKHVDVAELLRLVDPAPGVPDRLEGVVAGAGTVYRPPVRDFALWTLRASAGPAVPGAGPRIVVSCGGRATVSGEHGSLDVDPGECVFLTHADGPVELTTDGLLAVVHCPETAPSLV
ncbi:mannose-6-phosphate isomerase, class I [Georgenia muralis]|uniref:mannose-6-phosphate isomerase n=1 Tax=Georgenia muralis TaxID=154117 RepID=A0A3N4Z6B6_9MICO|nr:mannose-6-phosphate isomerase, class I [Georgenia muralis]RPF28939.1 mannose-6-phosphate isomerase type 1 [Georgenia muralis]